MMSTGYHCGKGKYRASLESKNNFIAKHKTTRGNKTRSILINSVVPTIRDLVTVFKSLFKSFSVILLSYPLKI